MDVPSFARRVPAIPSSDLASLRRPWLLTTAGRLALALALLALLAAAFIAARSLEPREAAFVAEGTTGIVVLDVSQSVTDPVYRRIARTLRRLSESNQSVGLIVFSDIPYEMLPPGSPASELRPLIRFFAPRPGFNQNTLGPRYPQSPWRDKFSGGTAISTGLEAALAVLEDEGLGNGSVLLLSDLDTAPSDETNLTRVLASFQTDRIPLRVVPLFPNSSDRLYFQDLVGESAFVTPQQLDAQLGRAVGEDLVGADPALLALFGGLLIFALAANEWWCRRVEVPRVAV